jgi:dienelactone hydrolase
MKHIASCLLLFALFGLPLRMFAQNPGCDGQRYKTDVFSTVKKTTVNYSTASTQTGTAVTLAMDVYEPETDNLGARPVVVLAHGGSFIIGNKTDMKSYCERLAKRGYIAASIQYRLFPLFQLGLPDSVEIFDQAVRAVGDMKAAVRYFRQDAATTNQFRADAGNIFIGGFSAGAVTALHAAYLDSTDVIPAFIQSALDANGGLDGNSGSAANQSYDSSIKAVLNMSGGLYRSAWVAGPGAVPLASIHGTADGTVPYTSGLAANLAYLEGSALIHQQAETQGLWHRLQTVPGGDHTNIYEPGQPAYVPHVDTFWNFATAMMETLICQTLGTETTGARFEDWSLFPNPAPGGAFTLQLPEDVDRVSVSLSDVSGKIVWQGFDIPNRSLVRSNGVPAGLYIVRVAEAGPTGRLFAVKKLVLEK